MVTICDHSNANEGLVECIGREPGSQCTSVLRGQCLPAASFLRELGEIDKELEVLEKEMDEHLKMLGILK